MSKLISIIVNCYNGEKYLKQTLESIQKQNYTNWELIFWDNQSTDNSKAIFDSFNEPRFKYFYSEISATSKKFEQNQKSLSRKYFLCLDFATIPQFSK